MNRFINNETDKILPDCPNDYLTDYNYKVYFIRYLENIPE